jgi:hypothetical protein
MKFKTLSGTEYILNNIEMIVEATGEPCPAVGPQGIPVRVSYTGSLARIGDPMKSLFTGDDLKTTEEFHTVEFASKPEVGVRFTYYHPEWFGCYSTAVTEIEEEEL